MKQRNSIPVGMNLTLTLASASAPPSQPDSPVLLVLVTLHIGLDMLPDKLFLYSVDDVGFASFSLL